jgi:hypothetical protein
VDLGGVVVIVTVVAVALLTAADLIIDDRLAARRGARDLRAAILTAGAGLLLITAATAVVWFGP